MTGHDKSCLAGIDKDAEMVVGVNCLGILRHSRSLAGSTVCVGEMKQDLKITSNAIVRSWGFV